MQARPQTAWMENMRMQVIIGVQHLSENVMGKHHYLLQYFSLMVYRIRHCQGFIVLQCHSSMAAIQGSYEDSASRKNTFFSPPGNETLKCLFSQKAKKNMVELGTETVSLSKWQIHGPQEMRNSEL